LPTFHDLSGSNEPLPEGIDGGSLRDVFANGNKGIVKRGAPGIVHHYTCHYHPPISSIIIGDFRLMKQLVTGEFKLFNIKEKLELKSEDEIDQILKNISHQLSQLINFDANPQINKMPLFFN
jgi:hypothetical protein